MRSFTFRLEQLLVWRRAQAGVEMRKLPPLVAEILALSQRAADLDAAWQRAASDLRGQVSFSGRDLAAFDAYRARLCRETVALAGARAAAEGRMAEQTARWLKARRSVEALEGLKARRWAEWTTEWNRELEAFASEAYLARWNRPEPG